MMANVIERSLLRDVIRDSGAKYVVSLTTIMQTLPVFAIMTKRTPHIKPPTHNEELQQRNRFGNASRKLTGGIGVKPVLLARNLTF